MFMHNVSLYPNETTFNSNFYEIIHRFGPASFAVVSGTAVLNSRLSFEVSYLSEYIICAPDNQ